MTKKKSNLYLSAIFFTILILIITIPTAMAVGLAGAVLEKIFFTPGFEKTYSYVIISNTDRAMDHEISTGGDLGQYFTPSINKINLPLGGTAQFTATMKLPQELTPGEHRAYICAGESQPRGGGSIEGGASIGARAVVCGVIIVFSPYPGKALDFFAFDVKNVSRNENATFKMDVLGLGTETVNAHAVVEVYSPEIEPGKENKIVTLITGEKSVSTGQYVSFNASFNVSDLEVGEYNAKATVYFDGNQTTKEKSFRVGELYINITDITKEVTKNKLNPIKISTQSKWNGPIKNVYATLEVHNPSRSAALATINTPPVDLQPWESKDLTAYWDTTGFEEGSYPITVTLHYEDKTTVKQDTISVKFVEGLPISATTILLFALILVVIVLILFIIRLMRRMQGKVKQVVKVKEVKVKIKKGRSK